MDLPYRLRIAFDGRAIYPELDGIGRYSLGLLRHLARLDDRNRYVVLRNGRVEGSVVQAANFEEVTFAHPHLSLATHLRLPGLLRRLGVDLYHAPFFVGPLAGRVPAILTAHDLMALNFQGFFAGHGLLKARAAWAYHRLFVPASLRRARRVVAVSQATAHALALAGFGGPRVRVIGQGIDEAFLRDYPRVEVEAYRAAKGLPRGFILYVGHLKPYKNLPTLLRAYALAKGRGLSHRLVVAGRRGRLYPELARLAAELNIAAEVIFAGYVAQEELPLLISAAAVFVFPSLAEGFGLPPLEAMALGVPTVVSDIPALAEVTGEGALRVPPHDPDRLAEAMLSLATRPELAARFSELGRSQARTHSWERAARQVLALYAEVAQEVG